MRTAIVLLLLTSAVAPAADPPKAKLAELVRLYQAYDLPAPPKDAVLVHIAVPSRVFVNGKEQPPRTTIGFLLAPAGNGTLAKVLTGTTQLIESEPVFIKEVKPEPASLAEIHNGPKDLDFAIQCEHRGWHELATSVFQNWEAETENRNPESALAMIAWSHWQWTYYHKVVDRAKLARRMTAAMNAAPVQFDKDDKAWLRQLNLSLRPSKAMPGSVAGYIDEFIELDGWEIASLCRQPVRAQQFVAVVSQGLDAVPVLLEHLNDQRLTRARSPGFNRIPGKDMLVRDFVRDILLDLATGADEELITSTWKKRTDPKPWQTWLDAAKKQGEEAYLVAHLFTTPKHRPQSTVNQLMLFVLERKYPHRLPELLRDALKNRPKVDLEPLTSAVARCSLKADEKKKLLLEVVASDDVARMRAGVGGLYEVDRDAFHTSLADVIDRLPGRFHENYRYRTEAQFADEVARTTNPKVWAAALKYARRADVGARMEWVYQLVRPDKDPVQVKLRLQFATAFQDDPATQEAGNGVAPETTWDGRDFENLEVRNLTAMCLGGILRAKPQPNPVWTADDWAKFRDEVAKAVKEAK